MLLFISAATLLLVVATLLPLWRNPHWLVRSMDFARLQIAALALVLLVLQYFLLQPALASDWVLIVSTFLCLAWQLWWILPYTRLWSQEVQTTTDDSPDRQLSILTANVLAPNRNASALLSLIDTHQPDIVVTLESDQWWQQQLDRLLPTLPFSIKHPLDNLYGMHVYTRFPIADHKVVCLVQEDVPSIHATIELPDGEPIRIHFLHPAPPSPTENKESKERDAELILVAKNVATENRPVVVTGDLNDVAWSATTRLFRKISGLLDPRVGRGMFNTFHAGYPFLRWPLDHLFHSSHFTLRSLERLPSIDSDHFPLLTRLTYSPVIDEEQEGLQADGEDHAHASEIISRVESGND